jgi:hypothetical protein
MGEFGKHSTNPRHQICICKQQRGLRQGLVRLGEGGKGSPVSNLVLSFQILLLMIVLGIEKSG